MDTLYYQIYWQLEDGTKRYHMDPVTARPWRFYTYDECFWAGNTIDHPFANAKVMFEAIRK